MPPADPVDRHLRFRLHHFPDPSYSGGRISLLIRANRGSNLNPNSPSFQSAQRACQGDLPCKLGGGAHPGAK